MNAALTAHVAHRLTSLLNASKTESKATADVDGVSPNVGANSDAYTTGGRSTNLQGTATSSTTTTGPRKFHAPVHLGASAGRRRRPGNTPRADVSANYRQHALQQQVGSSVEGTHGHGHSHGAGYVDNAAPSKTFSSKSDAIKALEKDFGVKVVDGGSGNKKWKKAELEMMYDGFSKLSANEKGALDGVKLVRKSKLSKNRDGEFSWKAGSDSNNRPYRKEEIRMADSAFKDNGTARHVAIHEASHAVETKEKRDALYNEAKAIDESNKGGKSYIRTLNGNLRRLNGRDPKQKAYADAALKAHDLTQKLLGESDPAKIKDIRTELDSAIADRNTKAGELSGKAKTRADAINAAQDGYKDKLVASKDAAEATKAATGKNGHSARLDKFVDYVNKHNIEPVTDYAKDNWPTEPGEFYAEAYTLFKLNPEKLKKENRLLWCFFEHNKHL